MPESRLINQQEVDYRHTMSEIVHNFPYCDNHKKFVKDEIDSGEINMKNAGFDGMLANFLEEEANAIS